MKRTLDVMVVPVGREPEFKTLESDESGSFLKTLQGCVGGLIEPLPWLFDDAPAGYCNEEGALGATFLDANRAVYATKAMEDADSRGRPLRHRVRRHGVHRVRPRDGREPRHLPRGVRARPRALRRRGLHRLGRERAPVPRPRRQAPQMKRPERAMPPPRPPPGIRPSLQVHPPWEPRCTGRCPGAKGREKPSAERTRS